MKLTGLVAPPDDRALYRQIAAMAIDGEKEPEKKAAAVQLFESGPDQETQSKESIAKLVATLRSRLASVDMGRFSVSHNGGATAYVTVNSSPVRARKPKKPAAVKPATAKAAGK